MEIIRIPSNLLTDRLDARYNSPSAVLVRQHINNCGLSNVKIGNIFEKLVCGPFGSTLTADEHFSEGEVLLVQPTNINSDLFSVESSWRITKQTLLEKNLPIYPANTFLFARVGVYPHVGVLPEWAGTATISSSMIAGLPNGKVDMHYLLAFFRSSYGIPLLFAAQKVTAQPTIGTYEIESTVVPIASKPVQTYIGDKVRWAEQLRERARGLEESARSLYFQSLCGLGYKEIQPSKTYRSILKERLDPNYYSPEYTSLLDADWFLSNCLPLSNFIIEGTYGILPDSSSYGVGEERLLRATDLASCNLDSLGGVFVPSDQIQSKACVKPNDILMEIKGAIEQCVVASHIASGAYVNGSVYRFSVKNIPLGYLAVHLTGLVKKKYCSRESVNNIIQYLNLECINRLPVLRLSNEVEEEISYKYLKSIDSQILSFALLVAAKLLVEALIEGKITEAELINAQEALEKGDIDPDWKIMSRLTRKGIDVKDEPSMFLSAYLLYDAVGKWDIAKGEDV